MRSACDQREPGAVRAGDPLLDAEVEHAAQERRAVDWLEEQHAAAPADEARDVRHRALERRPVAARDRQAAEDDGVVEGADAEASSPATTSPCSNGTMPGRDERARLVARRLDRRRREVDADDLARRRAARRASA